MSKFRNALVVAMAASLIGTGAWAQNTITSGSFTVGIGTNGELFDSNAYIGFRRDSDGTDPLAPGTPRDSWGISTNLGSAWADQFNFGSNGVSTTFGAFGGSSTTAFTTTNVGVTVLESYSFAADNILKIHHTVTNTSEISLSVLFQRDWDTDPQPTFNNNSFGPVGSSPYVVDASYDGFESPDPNTPYASSCLPNCNVDGDLGGGIKIGLGTLGAGQSISFDYYYGISQVGQDINGLIAQAQGLGAAYIMASQSDENGLYPQVGTNSQFIAIGGSVPEPASWALMLAGFGLTGAALRRQRVRAAFA